MKYRQLLKKTICLSTGALLAQIFKDYAPSQFHNTNLHTLQKLFWATLGDTVTVIFQD